MESKFITTNQLRKTFVMGSNKVNALAGIDLSISKDSFTVVMGPSGSGKSTLLYLVGGLDRPTSGWIGVNGIELGGMDENTLAVYRRKTVGFIFQSFNLVTSMTALDNVAFPMRFSGISRKKRKQKALEVLEQVGLKDRAHHRPTELSGGQQQRVAIARALVNDPQLILADEPTGNLDTTSGWGVMQLMSNLHKLGKTVMVVTHDPRMTKFSTHQIYLLDGNVVDETSYTASQIAAQPESV
jgi:putative ABC transport system ATP-binding protein